MKLSFSVARLAFFDKPVLDHLSRAARAVLSRFGAYVRQDARRSIKVRPKTADDDWSKYRAKLRLWAAGRITKRPESPQRHARAGSPPFARNAKSPIRLILFAYDAREQSVTAGPAAFGRKPGEATAALEYGGRSTSDGRPIDVDARPFMTPAFDKNLPHLSNWRNAA